MKKYSWTRCTGVPILKIHKNLKKVSKYGLQQKTSQSVGFFVEKEKNS